MHNDPELQGISHLLMDEIHERDVTSDFFMAVMKELTTRRNIKVVLMSATMNSHMFSAYFNNCPMLEIPGSMFPVKVHFLEDILSVIKPNSSVVQSQRSTGMGRRGATLGRSNNNFHAKKTDYAIMMKQYLERLNRTKEYPNNVVQQLTDFKVEFLNVENVFNLINHICFEKRQPGAILVFLPGWDSISNLYNMLDECGRFPEDEFLIIALHSSTSIQHQQLAFQTPKPGVRKIVIATNIAETSITIDDIVFVIDCGLCKVNRFDATKKITTLDTEFISKASLLQRRGRAGRLQEGECYHFITKVRDQRLQLEPDPEIRRSRIEDIIIKCKLLPLGKTQDFLQKLLNPPPVANIRVAIETLIEAQVLDIDENLTPLGNLIAFLPVDHFLAKMIILGVFFRCLDPILSIAASLSLKDPFVLQPKLKKELELKKLELDQKRYSDHLLIGTVMRLWEEAVGDNRSEEFCKENFVSEATLEFLGAIKQQLADCLHEMKFIPSGNFLNYTDQNLNVNSYNVAVLRAVVCAALYPNVANVKSELIMMNNQQVPALETYEDKQVYLGFKSVNAKTHHFPSKYLVYFTKQSCGNKVWLHDSTMVSLQSLVLFANRVDVSFSPLVVIKNIPYDMSRNKDILTLRNRFHAAFKDFTANPRLIPVDSDEETNVVVSQIVKLLSSEEEKMQ
ncbi:ATP-dependent DNA/RNA helicase DHX36-like [Nilaparvata lugens]|uniref:ATP-dependent DNA/RNA helicase DHX36-like n=1 Tax=Nilaparvata lugens TaxID=108931 RepID=UPI00193D44A0|nr:ATP-dependent DNA/RNA helicase DHX36-like [Nilaparvata lugens]